MKVIDCHMHVGGVKQWLPDALQLAPGFAGENGLAQVLDPEGAFRRPEFLHLLNQFDVAYAVVMPPIVGYGTDHEWLAGFVKGLPQLLPLVNINLMTEPDPPGFLRYWVEERRFKGLKLVPCYHHFYPNDAALYPLYAEAQKLAIPVVVHTGTAVFRGSRSKYGEPLFLDDVAVDFPDLTIVMAHAGRGCWYDQAAFLAQLHRNIYLEISGIPPKNLLEHFPHLEKLSDKVLFGSDWPASPGLKYMLDGIAELPISQEVKEKMLYINASKLYGL